MKSVLISIRPQWCEKIASGKKTIEVRKSAPKVPFKAYIYETYDKKYDDIGICWGKGKCFEHGCKKVIGEFICDKVDKIIPLQHTYYNYIGLPIANITEYGICNDDLAQMCLKKKEIDNYSKGKTLYGWHISDLKIYDKPKELRKFRKPLDRVWGSYCNDYCDQGCISFGSTDYSCNDYWNWKKGLTRPPQSWQYVEKLEK